MATVVRTQHRLGKRDGYTTLEQQFRFDGVDAAAVAGVLISAPLVGSHSVFGNRPGVEGSRTDKIRTLEGFSPAPGFRFDVEMAHDEDVVFRVRFAQPDRKVPYLEGDFIWTITDEADGALFDEEINTDRALQVASYPLSGTKPSLRRWLFFRVGHRQVMAKATSNIASLLNRS